MDGVGIDDKFGKRPRIEVDVAFYQDMLDDPSLSDEQKKQIIEALWSIIVAFVDLGFGVHPAQAANPCGKDDIPLIAPPQDSPDPVYSKQLSESRLDKAADDDDPPAEKEESDDKT
ncbi:hypothetical protein [Leisingera caerulea]|uniref:hypothetical protein n=1 Tax=Leisingera caerulea TaxID=506591 RepID=UPI0021A56050|nr:hypothetical protein [Leisingera caerulea]UWQ83108.1 hypothetical protein K3726_15800 [Leisingera caerulea]